MIIRLMDGDDMFNWQQVELPDNIIVHTAQCKVQGIWLNPKGVICVSIDKPVEIEIFADGQAARLIYKEVKDGGAY